MTKPTIFTKDFSLIPEEPQWYIVTTRTNYEFKYKHDFLEGLEAHNLKHLVKDLFIPIKKCICQNGKNKKVITEKIISLYVFIKCIMTDNLYTYMHGIAGFTSLVSIGGSPSTIDEARINEYRHMCDVPPIYNNMVVLSKEDPYLNPIDQTIINDTHKQIINNIYNLEKQVKLNILHDKIIKKIYRDEILVKQSSLLTKEENKETIDFNELNLSELTKKLNRYHLTREFMNLTTLPDTMSENDKQNIFLIQSLLAGKKKEG